MKPSAIAEMAAGALCEMANAREVLELSDLTADQLEEARDYLWAATDVLDRAIKLAGPRKAKS